MPKFKFTVHITKLYTLKSYCIDLQQVVTLSSEVADVGSSRQNNAMNSSISVLMTVLTKAMVYTVDVLSSQQHSLNAIYYVTH